MAHAPCLTAPAQKYLGSSESLVRSRRLGQLREQLVRENRRSAAPFSHPLASRGPLQSLCNQIRDVSRIADAIAISADSASDVRLQELCSDLRRLLQTQQRWTERLENQIWRLESQGKLMKRLQQVLQQGSPGTDQIWELCELIARETQAIPEGILLLPEPGHRIAIVQDGTSGLTANAIEKARISVYAGMSMMPEIRGADLVAASFLTCFSSAFRNVTSISETQPDIDWRIIADFSSRLEASSVSRPIGSNGTRLVDVAFEFCDEVERHSLKAKDNVVPPPLREYYAQLTSAWPSVLDRDEASREIARTLCEALGLSDIVQTPENIIEKDGDDKLVLFHKLRWHEGDPSESVNDPTSDSESDRLSDVKAANRSIRRPRFLQSTITDGVAPKFRVFSED